MLSAVTSPSLSSEEQEQILQTIEMFEVITQANPQDCQSMDILKDAYQRVGKQKEALTVARKLADTYVELGQFSAAMLEYEGILQKEPDNAEVIAALGDVEEKLQKSGQLKPAAGGLGGTDGPPPPSSHRGIPGPVIPPLGSSAPAPASKPGAIAPPSGINLDFRTITTDGGTLMTTAATLRPDGGSTMRLASGQEINLSLAEDGNEALAKFLIQHRLVTEEVVSSALERVQKKNRDLAPNVMATSLVDEICRRGAIEQDVLLAGIVDRSKFAYIPMEYYDVDRSIVKMLPESLSIGRLIVPFDIISRTVMIAMANPFDALGKEAVQQLLDYNVQWHLCSPQAIFKALQDTYRI